MHNIEEKQGYKFTEEFGYIPEDWDILNIIETSILKARIGWQGLTTAEYLKSGDYYLVTGTDFSNGKIDWDNCNYVDKNRYEQDKNIQIKEGDILITKDGTIGKVAYIDNILKPTTLNSGIFVVRPKEKNYNTKYLYYVLMSNIFAKFLIKLTAGSTIMHLYQKDFIGFDFPAPNELPEQEKIAEVLSDIDELIESTQKLIDKKKDLKTATMQKLLAPKKDWTRTNLGCIANIQRGASPRPIESPVWFDSNSNIGWTRISDIRGKYLKKTEQKLSRLGIANSRFIKENSLIMSICATLGRPTITKVPVCIHDGFVCFFNLTQDIEFVYYFLEFIKGSWLSQGQVGSQSNLNSDLIKNMIICFPRKDKQHQIAQTLSDMDAEIEALEKELNKYKDLKTGMIQELLTGKKRLV